MEVKPLCLYSGLFSPYTFQTGLHFSIPAKYQANRIVVEPGRRGCRAIELICAVRTFYKPYHKNSLNAGKDQFPFF